MIPNPGGVLCQQWFSGESDKETLEVNSPTATLVKPGKSMSVRLTTAVTQELDKYTNTTWKHELLEIDVQKLQITDYETQLQSRGGLDGSVYWNRGVKFGKCMQDIPFGEYMLKWIGTGDICFERPVIRSVSSDISFLTRAAWDCKFHELCDLRAVTFGKIEGHSCWN